MYKKRVMRRNRLNLFQLTNIKTEQFEYIEFEYLDIVWIKNIEN